MQFLGNISLKLFYYDTLGRMEHNIRQELIWHFGSTQYFEMRNGKRLISPEDQEVIAPSAVHRFLTVVEGIRTTLNRHRYKYTIQHSRKKFSLPSTSQIHDKYSTFHAFGGRWKIIAINISGMIMSC
jgi:hypothetical protein